MLGTQQYLTAHIEMAQRAQFLYITTIKLFSLEKKHSGKRKPRAYLNTIKNPSTGSHRSLAVFCKQCAWISRRTKRARSALIRFCAQTPTRQTPPDKRRNSFIPQVPMSAQDFHDRSKDNRPHKRAGISFFSNIGTDSSSLGDRQEHGGVTKSWRSAGSISHRPER